MLCAGLHISVSISEFSLLLSRQGEANCIHFSRRPIRGGGVPPAHVSQRPRYNRALSPVGCPHSVQSDELKQLALAVLATEAEAVLALGARIDERFVRACELMLACEGRIVVTGMGKSGHIGGKI